MKKFNLFTLYFFALGITLAQTVEDFNTPLSITDNNMSVLFSAGMLNDFAGGLVQAYVNGAPVSDATTLSDYNTFTALIREDGSAGFAVFGSTAGYPALGIPALFGADVGDEIQFAILMDGSSIFIVDINPPITYSPNGFIMVSGSINISSGLDGCTDYWADNFDPYVNMNDGSCYKIGCTDPEANNYDSLATDQDNSCVYNTPISFQLSSGWNMVGYTGTADNNGIVHQMDAALVNGAGTANTFQVIKNVSGAFWSAAFAQITEFIPGEGYMMFVNGDTTTVNFQNTSGYISDIEYSLSSGWNMVAFTGDIDSEKNIVNAMDAALGNGAGTANTFQVIKNVSGAFWSAAFAQITEFTPGEAYMMFVNGTPTTVNFNSEANMADGNFVEYAVGMEAEGGIVFYVDETGQHGLVAAMEDLTEGATPYGWGINGYEWGCYSENVSGADGQAIGTGYQNTMDIVNQGCVTDNGGITAAQAALDAEINGYSDWYLPSKDELYEMYSTIGNEGLEGNIGGFASDWSYYWSSSENGNGNAWGVYFYSGNPDFNPKGSAGRVRVIRAF